MRDMEKFTKEDLLEVLPTAIMNSKELTAKQKIVLAQLYMYDGLEKSKINGCSFRSNKDFCNDIGIDKNTLLTALRKLEEMKFISRNVGSRHNGASEYTILKDNINDWCKGEINSIKIHPKIHPNETENSPYNSPYWCKEKIAELSDRIRVLEDLVEKLKGEIHSIKIHPNNTENSPYGCKNSPSDTDTDTETESETEKDEKEKKGKYIKEKKEVLIDESPEVFSTQANEVKSVEVIDDNNTSNDEIVEELSFDKPVTSTEDNIDQQTMTSSNEVIISEQVEEGASIEIEASDSPESNLTSANEVITSDSKQSLSDNESHEQAMAKIRPSIEKLSTAQTEKDLKDFRMYAEMMVGYYSKGDREISTKAKEKLEGEYEKNLERINSISRHQYVAGHGFKTLK